MRNRKVVRIKGDEPTKFFSGRQERTAAKAIRGQVQPASGATFFAPGDIKTSEFLIECKTKMKDSSVISIRKEWLEKTEKEALFIGKPHTALIFNFGPESKNYYIVSEEVFKHFVKEE